MKIPYTFLAAILIMASSFLPQQAVAQAPEKMSYQAIVRDSGDNLLVSQLVGMQISILQTTAGGTAVYVETHSPTTNVNGLVTLEIGTGNVVSGDFTTIDWSGDTYFIKTETDPTGGASYTITGTSQLVSVPYALYAKTASSATETQTLANVVALGNAADAQIKNVTDPTDAQDANTKVYVDDLITALDARISALEVIPVPNVTSPTGRIWMDRNLGASQVATSSTDAASYGDLYQWGRATDGHQIRTSATTTTLSSTDTPGNANFILARSSPNDWRSPQNTNLWQGVSGVNNPCPAGYRLPTEAEWDTERLSWSENNSVGAFASPLKLPVAGRRRFNIDELSGVGSEGYYWSSTVDGTRSLSLYLGGFVIDFRRANGVSVRCIKD